jgi:hypothetical protein
MTSSRLSVLLIHTKIYGTVQITVSFLKPITIPTIAYPVFYWAYLFSHLCVVLYIKINKLSVNKKFDKNFFMIKSEKRIVIFYEAEDCLKIPE